MSTSMTKRLRSDRNNASVPAIATKERRRTHCQSVEHPRLQHAAQRSVVPDLRFKLRAYNVSKSAVNAYKVQLAYELRATPIIKVNAAHPGWVKTEMGGEGARTSVVLAMLGPDGPTGSFSHMGEALPW
jgi:NAD(P)-dependent dehydrogenase (short-subunit alcohol dehydrogenase family)